MLALWRFSGCHLVQGLKFQITESGDGINLRLKYRSAGMFDRFEKFWNWRFRYQEWPLASNFHDSKVFVIKMDPSLTKNRNLPKVRIQQGIAWDLFWFGLKEASGRGLARWTRGFRMLGGNQNQSGNTIFYFCRGTDVRYIPVSLVCPQLWNSHKNDYPGNLLPRKTFTSQRKIKRYFP